MPSNPEERQRHGESRVESGGNSASILGGLNAEGNRDDGADAIQPIPQDYVSFLADTYSQSGGRPCGSIYVLVRKTRVKSFNKKYNQRIAGRTASGNIVDEPKILPLPGKLIKVAPYTYAVLTN